MTERITKQTIEVVRWIWLCNQSWGYEIMRETGLPSGVVYPVLKRLRQDGHITGKIQRFPGKPKSRRLYRLTDEGLEFWKEYLN